MLFEPSLDEPDDFSVRDQFTCLGLGEAVLDGNHEDEGLDRVIDRGVFGQVLKRLHNFSLRGQ